MNKKIIKHFKAVDTILFSVIDKVSPIEPPTKSKDYFSSLCREIICQQLSNKAGTVILGRFQKLFPNKRVTAKRILRLTKKQIRNAGPSWAKVDYVRDLAKKVINGQLNLKSLDKLDNDAVIKELTKVQGIGPWTAEMFLMFSLGREDVFSFGDLGLRKAIQKIYNLKKEPTRKQMEKITMKWSPYRTYACHILWKSLEL